MDCLRPTSRSSAFLVFCDGCLDISALVDPSLEEVMFSSQMISWTLLPERMVVEQRRADRASSSSCSSACECEMGRNSTWVKAGAAKVLAVSWIRSAVMEALCRESMESCPVLQDDCRTLVRMGSMFAGVMGGGSRPKKEER